MNSEKLLLQTALFVQRRMRLLVAQALQFRNRRGRGNSKERFQNLEFRISQFPSYSRRKHMSVHDEAMANRVHEALGRDKRLSGLPIGVRVSNGDVFLKGSVDSLHQLDAVQFVVSGMAGVRHVDTSEVEVKETAR